VRAAQADALAEQGRLRASVGGAVAELRDVVVMTAGFEAEGVNSGDVIGPEPDVEAARAFFAEHGVSWGLRVPEEMPWKQGRLLFRRRLMGMERAAFRAAAAVPGLEVRAAGPEDLASVLRIDSTAFGLDVAENRRWLEPLLAAERVEFALGSVGGEPAGTAYVLRSDGGAGPSAYLAGVAVLPAARRRGVAAGVSSWLLERAFERGAELAHLNPDTDAAARIYERLGFGELPGHDIYIGL
jgi:ribosomal protein S18 acetylase RimI-like enzyme